MAWQNKFLISFFFILELKGIGRGGQGGQGSPPGRLLGSSSAFVRAGLSVHQAGEMAAGAGQSCPCSPHALPRGDALPLLSFRLRHKEQELPGQVWCKLFLQTGLDPRPGEGATENLHLKQP